MSRWMRIETRSGEPISSGNLTLVPFSQSIRFKFPFWIGGVIWNRPVSVLVQGADGQETVLPVPDVTRQVQISLLTASLFSVLFFWVFYRTRKRPA
jgi:hypothetical protein